MHHDLLVYIVILGPEFHLTPPTPAQVLATCRSPDRAKELSSLLNKSHQPAAIALDTADDATIIRAFQTLQQRGVRKLDLLFHNAGIVCYGGQWTRFVVVEVPSAAGLRRHCALLQLHFHSLSFPASFVGKMNISTMLADNMC